VFAVTEVFPTADARGLTFGLHVEFHVHDLPRSGNPKNLTVKIGALHRESFADPEHLPQEFPPNSIKSIYIFILNH
jgi:hypothetical protein